MILYYIRLRLSKKMECGSKKMRLDQRKWNAETEVSSHRQQRRLLRNARRRLENDRVVHLICGSGSVEKGLAAKMSKKIPI